MGECGARLRRCAVPAALSIVMLTAAGGSIGCGGSSPPPRAAEETANQDDTMADRPGGLPSADRGAPVRVPAVERGGVRYEQHLGATVGEFGQVGGILLARDAASGAVLWTLKVYPNERRPSLEGDVQDVFFRSIAFDPQGTLVIEDERGRRFAVDVAARTVAAIE